MRNGPGELILSNKDRIKAIWQNDMINGEGSYFAGQKEIKCAFYDDVRIELETSEEYDDCYIFNIILFIAIIGSLIAAIVT